MRLETLVELEFLNSSFSSLSSYWSQTNNSLSSDSSQQHLGQQYPPPLLRPPRSSWWGRSSCSLATTGRWYIDPGIANISKGIWRQGVGPFVRSSYGSTLCPVVMCPYLCTSDWYIRRGYGKPGLSVQRVLSGPQRFGLISMSLLPYLCRPCPFRSLKTPRSQTRVSKT